MPNTGGAQCDVCLSNTAVAIASDGPAAPEWVQLFPSGPEITARDGRQFRLSDPQTIVDAFHALARDLPIDIEHATQARASEGLDAIAVGWIGEVDVRDGAVWGRVEWTDQGRDWVAARAYRYLSPAFEVRVDTSEITGVISAGLTNTPAFKMAALAREASPTSIKETPPMKDVLQELGLAAGASEADAVTAIKSLKTTVQTAKAAAPDPDKYIAKAQYDATVEKLTALETANAERADADVVAAVNAAVTDGKIAPAAKDAYLDTARTIGLEKFKGLVATMPKLGVAEDIEVATATATESGALSSNELHTAKMLGLTADEFAAQKDS